MRFILCLSIGVLFLTGKCASDDSTSAEWILGQVFITDTNIACMTKDERDKNCIVYFQCKRSATFLIDDVICIMDIRSNSCPRHRETNCTNNDINIITLLIDHVWKESNRSIATTTRTAAPTTTTTPVTTTAKYVSKFTCSVYNVNGTEFANNDENPWEVTVLMKAENMQLWYVPEYLGNGVLIHPSVVLIRARILYRKGEVLEANEIQCRAGEKAFKDSQSYSFQTKNVAKRILHGNEYANGFYTFIALLFLEEPFQLNAENKVLPVCLSNVQTPEDYECFGKCSTLGSAQIHPLSTTGWRKVQIRLVDREMCGSRIKNDYDTEYNVSEIVTCGIGDVGVSSYCKGILGTPVVCPILDSSNNIRYAVFAMTMFSVTYTYPREPQMYLNMSYVKNWIDDQMKQEGLEPYTYTI